MKQEELKKLAMNQLSTLKEIAKSNNYTELEHQFEFMSATLKLQSTSDSHDDVEVFYDYEEDYEDEDFVPYPEGFNSREEYLDFVEEQEQEIADDVVGTVPDNNGGYKEVGSFKESLGRAYESLETQNTYYDEETGEDYQEEIPAVPEMSILISRDDEEELTVEDVKEKVFKHPQAQTMLKVFGNDFDVTNHISDHQKLATFLINQSDPYADSMAKVLQHGSTANFGGKIVVPGVGVVQASPVLG